MHLSQSKHGRETGNDAGKTLVHERIGRVIAGAAGGNNPFSGDSSEAPASEQEGPPILGGKRGDGTTIRRTFASRGGSPP